MSDQEPLITDAKPPVGPIQEIRRFLRDGCVIEQLTLFVRDVYALIGNPQESEFVGEGVVNINGPRGPMQQRFRFKIDAKTIEEAFDKFGAAADGAVAEMDEQHKAAKREAMTKLQFPS